MGAAISFIIGFMLNLPQPQVIISSVMTATLVFSGLVMHSFGRREQDKEHKTDSGIAT